MITAAHSTASATHVRRWCAWIAYMGMLWCSVPCACSSHAHGTITARSHHEHLFQHYDELCNRLRTRRATLSSQALPLMRRRCSHETWFLIHVYAIMTVMGSVAYGISKDYETWTFMMIFYGVIASILTSVEIHIIGSAVLDLYAHNRTYKLLGECLTVLERCKTLPHDRTAYLLEKYSFINACQRVWEYVESHERHPTRIWHHPEYLQTLRDSGTTYERMMTQHNGVGQ